MRFRSTLREATLGDPSDAVEPASARRSRWILPLAAMAIVGGPLFLVLAQADKEKKVVVADPFPGKKTKAPPLDGGLGWLNSAGPIELSKLKGKVVLLDFWTYCCINCMHILPDLAQLEKEFPNELVVIGVHSAKFEGEKDTENIREAVLRYQIEHPVVNDGAMAIWQNYGVRAWPTRVLVDPEGNYLGSLSGEGRLEVFRGIITKLVAYHEAKGTLDRTPLHFQLEEYGQKPTPLRFPGKVVVDAASGRMAIADSGHHRLVIADRDGNVEHVVGDGIAGLVDGPFNKARFFDPQGMAFDGSILYVADRKNHVIRKLDLQAKQASTVAGTGKQGHERDRTGPARDVGLASPWDLLLVGRNLFIAMAGTHQVWKLDLEKATVGPFAGSGGENVIDGPARQAELAQPSGLATNGDALFVADSEVSSVRSISLANGDVTTLVGTGLFEFGDRDGSQSRSLQHPLGVAFLNGVIYVADTYNNKVKTVDVARKSAQTFLGDKKAGNSDQPPRFDEPGGISSDGRKLYLADTNNHRVCVIDPVSKEVKTVALAGLKPPVLPESSIRSFDAPARETPPVTLQSKGPVQLYGSVVVPSNSKLSPSAPMSYRIDWADDAKGAPLAKGRINPPASSFKLTAPTELDKPTGVLLVQVTYYPCETGSEGVCRIKSAAWKVPYRIDPSSPTATNEIKLTP